MQGTLDVETRLIVCGGAEKKVPHYLVIPMIPGGCDDGFKGRQLFIGHVQRA